MFITKYRFRLVQFNMVEQWRFLIIEFLCRGEPIASLSLYLNFYRKTHSFTNRSNSTEVIQVDSTS